MLSQKVFLLYNPKNILFNHYHPFTRMASTWQSLKSIMVCIILKGSHCMVALTMLKLIDRSPMSINKPRYNIGPLLSRNSVSAAIAFQECIKSLPSIGAKRWNCCSNVWKRWCLNSCHFRGKRGNAKTITRVSNSASLEQGLIVDSLFTSLREVGYSDTILIAIRYILGYRIPASTLSCSSQLILCALPQLSSLQLGA